MGVKHVVPKADWGTTPYDASRHAMLHTYFVCCRTVPTKRPNAAPVTSEGTKRPLGMEMPYVQHDVVARRRKYKALVLRETSCSSYRGILENRESKKKYLWGLAKFSG